MIPNTIDREDLDFIRSLGDEDLTRLISEINDGGWMLAKRTLASMRRTAARRTSKVFPDSL